MRTKLLAAGAAVAMTMGVVAVLPAQAETPSPTPTTSVSAPSPHGAAGFGEHNGGHGHGGVDFNPSALATALGMDEQTVSDALSAVRDQWRSERFVTDETRGAHQDALAGALATELGIEESDVSEALSALQSERQAARLADDTGALDQAVADGTLTRDEANVVQKALDAGVVSVRGGGHVHR